MRVEFIPEPEIEFASGRHIDIRFGLMDYGPLDVDAPDLRTINVGIVGTTQTIEGLAAWLERCREEIPGKVDSKQPRLFPPFPGFRSDTGFRSTLNLEPRHLRAISQRDLERILRGTWSNVAIAEAVNLFREELEYLSENGTVDVVFCAPPMTLLDAMYQADSMAAPATDGDDEDDEDMGATSFNFRRLLKAKAMQAIRVPIQIVLPTTYSPEAKRVRRTRPHRPVRIQDEATRAWNIHTAIYYKAGGSPWRMVRQSTDLDTCYVGIGFYKSLDDEHVMTSMAQVFDERGEGLIVRGGRVVLAKDDRTPHLNTEDSYSLLMEALRQYRREHRNAPARVVVHKSSWFNEAEISGFMDAAADRGVEYPDLLSIRRGYTRLFRAGDYPPLRGTLLHLDQRSLTLYTKGSVDFFRTYPGMYVPRPLDIRSARSEQTMAFLAREALALTKMNWNNTQFDGGEPITLKAADKVGDVLKYLDEEAWVAPRYSYYM
jgi:hypothetical protein